MGVAFLRRGVVLGLLILAGCGAGTDEQRGFVPATYRDGARVVLPVTFPNGTSAELVYPPELDIAGLGVFPYTSGTLHGQSPTPGRSDFVARDFSIRYGDLEHVLAQKNGGTRPVLLAQYEGVDRQTVGFWDLQWDDTAHRLGFQFGRWTVLVYDYAAAGAMTDSERALWSANFSGHETADGFLLLEASGPLRLAGAGEHAGPELIFSASEPTRELMLYPGECRPHRDQNRRVDGKLVQWSRGFADWCLSDSMRIHAGGSQEFIGALIRGLSVRNVTLAKQ